MKNENIKVITSEKYLNQSKQSSESKSALDIYFETLIEELVPSAKEKIARYIFKFESLSSLDSTMNLTLEFKKGILNDWLGKECSSLTFDGEELTDKVHIEATRSKYFVGTDEHKDRIYATQSKRKWNEDECPVHMTKSGLQYVDGYELYHCCDACDDFWSWISTELEPFEEGIDFIRTCDENGLFVYILTLPTAISVISNTGDFWSGEEYRQKITNQLSSKLEEEL